MNGELETRIIAMEKMLVEIRDTLDNVQTLIVKADAVIDGVAKEVKPTLDTLGSHPMLKMFLGGKK